MIWHRVHIFLTGHKVRYTRVSPPIFDLGARGVLVRCQECPKVWAW